MDEVCGLFKLACMPEDVIKKKVFPLSLKGKALTWFRLCDDGVMELQPIEIGISSEVLSYASCSS